MLEARASYLERLPNAGVPGDILSEAILLTAVTGLPISAYRRYEYNRHWKSREDPAGGMTIPYLPDMQGHAPELGVLMVGRGWRELSVSERLEVATHEGLHANSIFSPMNAAYFGGEAQQAVLQDRVRMVAMQCNRTGLYLSAYHRRIAQRFAKGLIDQTMYLEETWAIAGTTALTGRDALRRVQEQQRNRVAQAEFISLLSDADDDIARGIDACLTAGLIDGVRTPMELKQHEATVAARADELVRYGHIKLRPSEHLQRIGRQLIRAMRV